MVRVRERRVRQEASENVAIECQRPEPEVERPEPEVARPEVLF